LIADIGRMEATRDRSSTEHPTMMELQRAQLEALQEGDSAAVAELQELIFDKLEEAQAELRLNQAA
jgi:hypothetical protein